MTKIDDAQWATASNNIDKCKAFFSTENNAGGIFSHKMVRINVVGAFYDKIKHYLTKRGNEKDSVESFLAELSLCVDKRYLILYFDGVFTSNIWSTKQFVPAKAIIEAGTMIDTLYNTAEDDGWCVFVQDGKAREAIVKEGGIAATHDSSMLDEPSIHVVIRPGTFQICKKQ